MVAALMSGDEGAVRYVFYDHYDQLLRLNARKACHGRIVDYDDLRQELFLYLCADNWRRLHRYDATMPFACWFSVVSYRFFKDYAGTAPVALALAEKEQGEAVGVVADQESETIAGIDLRDALDGLDSQRDSNILRSLLIDDEEPVAVAARHGITVENLYNIKRRALARLIRGSLKDYSE